MKIVNRAAFLSLPAGTVYSKYTPISFDDLCIKGDTWKNDFGYQGIADAIESDSSEDFFGALDRAETDGDSLKMDFECQGRDGFFDEDQLFAVWEPVDVAGLIARLQQALLDQAPQVPAPSPHRLCSGDGIGNTSCATPKHQATRHGRTYMDWQCQSCGGTGRSTWD